MEEIKKEGSLKEKQNIYRSFSQKINNNDIDEEPFLAKSSLYEQKYLERREMLPTILSEKIKKYNSGKAQAKINLEINEVKNLNQCLNLKEDEKNINKDDFIKVRKFPKVSNEQFELLENELIEENELDEIYEDITSVNYDYFDNIDYNSNVSCLLPLVHLIESKYEYEVQRVEEMENKLSLLQNDIYYYRIIKGDGNCFYRAVIFRFFEIIILSNNIQLLKSIIYEMAQAFQTNEIKSRKRLYGNFILKTNNVLKLLLIILHFLEGKNTLNAYYFFLEVYQICPSFDYGLIMYLRYIIYDYIKQNENKYYQESFPIKLGNLLPSIFETNNGTFLYNKFYYLYLLKMFMDAEKIVVYMIPYVLGIELNVLLFEAEKIMIQNSNFIGDAEYKFDNDIYVLNVHGHFELLYKEKDYNKYKSIFQNCIHNYQPLIFINEETYKKSISVSNSQKIKKEEKKQIEMPIYKKINPLLNKNHYISKTVKSKICYQCMDMTNKLKGLNITEKIPNEKFKNDIEHQDDNINEKDVNENIEINYQEDIEENIEKDIKPCLRNKKNDLGVEKSPSLKEGNEKVNDQKGIILKDYQCQICLKNYQPRGEEKIANICYKCLKEELIKQIYPKYNLYLDNILGNKEVQYQNCFNLFLQDHLDILKTTISIEDAVKGLYLKENKNLIDFNIHNFFREIKQYFCTYCGNEIEMNLFELPCGCNFCSKDHIKKYFHFENKINIDAKFICCCSYQYSNIDIYNLGLFFKKLQLASLKNDTIQLLNNYLSRVCSFCGMNIEEPIYRIKYKDSNIIDTLGDCYQIFHYNCEQCWEISKYERVFFCETCNRQHFLS